MTIPKLLWQTWKHPHPPKPLKRCIRSFHRLNPDWKIHLHTDEDIQALIDGEFPHLAESLARFPKGVHLADIWRCLVLYRHGGIYSDIDVECIRPLDELIEAALPLASLETEVFLSRDHPVHERCHFGGRAMFMNFFMIARPGSSFFGLYLEEMDRLARQSGDSLSGDPVALTGPARFSTLVERGGSPEALKIGVLPWQWVSPLPDLAMATPFEERGYYDKLIREGDWSWQLAPYVSHYWWHSYHSPKSLFTMYGDSLYQSKGLIASQQLERVLPEDDPASLVVGRAIAEFAELEQPVLLSLASKVAARTFRETLAEAFSFLSFDEIPDLSAAREKPVGLLLLSADHPGCLGDLNDAIRRGVFADKALVHVFPTSGHESFNEAIQSILLGAGFEVLEDEAGLLMRKLDPSQIFEIPKIIHQTWKTREIPDTFKREWIDSWMDLHAATGWEYRFWTDEDLVNLVEEHFPDFLDCYFDYDLPIKRVDAARYLILKKFGGVYADLDFAALKPFDDLLLGKRLLFGTEHENPMLSNSICNALMASVAEHPFWTGIETDLRRHADNEVLAATGPIFLSRRVRACAAFLDEEDIPNIARREVIYPFRWDAAKRDEARNLSLVELSKFYPESYAITFWTGTWL